MSNDVNLCTIVFDAKLVFSMNSMRPLFRISSIKINPYLIGSHSAGRRSIASVLLSSCSALMEWYLFLYNYSIMHDLHVMSADMHSSYEIDHLITVSYRKNPLYYCNTCVAYIYF